MLAPAIVVVPRPPLAQVPNLKVFVQHVLPPAGFWHVAAGFVVGDDGFFREYRLPASVAPVLLAGRDAVLDFSPSVMDRVFVVFSDHSVQLHDDLSGWQPITPAGIALG